MDNVTDTVEIDNTEVAETTEDTAVETAPVEDVPEEAVDAFDLDALLAETFDDDPIMQGTHKLGVPYEEVLRHIPENGRKVIQNLRSSYTQKTQEIAGLRKQLEAERADLLRQQELLTRSDWKKGIDDKANSEEKYDIWDTEGRQKEIERQAAKMMQEMLSPLQEEVQVKQRSLELQQFKNDHPDLREHRLDIARLLNDREDLSLEDAYWLVKGRKSQEAVAAAAADKKARRDQGREGLYKTSNGRSVSTKGMTKPQFKNAWESYQWHKSQQGK